MLYYYLLLLLFCDRCSHCSFQPVECIVIDIMEYSQSMFKILLTGMRRARGSWQTVVQIHIQVIWHGPICADTKYMDPDLSGSGWAGACVTKKTETWLPDCKVSCSSSVQLCMSTGVMSVKMQTMEMGDERYHSTPANWYVLPVPYCGHMMLFSTLASPGNLLQRTRMPKCKCKCRFIERNYVTPLMR